jgi:hypothetical protein
VALPALAQIGRRKRQLDTLRVMLRGVEELLSYAEQLATERELDSGEKDQAEQLAVRRDRLIKSIAETEQQLSSR